MLEVGGHEPVNEVRAQAVERLQRLAAGGALTAEELTDRTRRVRSAMTRAGVEQAFVGLPAEPGPGPSASSPPPSLGWAPMEPPPPVPAPGPAPAAPHVPQTQVPQVPPFPPVQQVPSPPPASSGQARPWPAEAQWPYVPPAGPPPGFRPVPTTPLPPVRLGGLGMQAIVVVVMLILLAMIVLVATTRGLHPDTSSDEPEGALVASIG